MAALDTNILVRLLVADDPRQTAAARELVAKAVRDTEVLFVPLSVALEVEWVIRSVYRHDKLAVVSVFKALLETTELEFQDERAVETALHLYQKHDADFAECLHLGCVWAHGKGPCLTFDRRAAAIPGAALLDA